MSVTVKGEPVITESDLKKLKRQIRKNQVIFFMLGIIVKVGFDLFWDNIFRRDKLLFLTKSIAVKKISYTPIRSLLGGAVDG